MTEDFDPKAAFYSLLSVEDSLVQLEKDLKAEKAKLEARFKATILNLEGSKEDLRAKLLAYAQEKGGAAISFEGGAGYSIRNPAPGIVWPAEKSNAYKLLLQVAVNTHYSRTTTTTVIDKESLRKDIIIHNDAPCVIDNRTGEPVELPGVAIVPSEPTIVLKKP